MVTTVMIGLLVTVSANQLTKSMERCLETLTVAQLLTKFFAFCELLRFAMPSWQQAAMCT